MVLERLEKMCDEGQHAGTAQRLLAAAKWASPTAVGTCRVVFPSSWAAAPGWSRSEPGNSRPPMPLSAALATVWHMAANGMVVEALCIWCQFETYLRVSECFRFRGYQILEGLAANGGATQHTTVLANARESDVPGKTGIYDLSIPLDLARQKHLGEALVRRARRVGKKQLLFPFDYQHIAN